MLALDLIDPLIDCEGCGACCMSIGVPPICFDDERQAIPAHLRPAINLAIALDRGELGLPCIWLDMDTRRCKHYEIRPSICQDFLVGGEDCQRLRRERLA